jgi:hypothetical protein
MRFSGFRVALSVLVLLVSLTLRSQTVATGPCEAHTAHPDWLIYTNRELHFCLRYPPTYHEVSVPSSDESSIFQLVGRLDLNELPPGTYGAPVDNKASIYFVLNPKSFSVKQLQTCCAPTGLDDTSPTTIHIAERVFYFYGPGGGGVDYPDDYLMEINGKILSIQFGGPWKDSKSPIEETKRLETTILSTLQTY